MSKIEVNEIVPQSGTTLTLGRSGDTLSIASGASSSFPSLTVSGDLTVDTNSLKVDSTNNRVGIGTASPGYNLDLSSSSDAVMNLKAAGQANGLQLSQLTADGGSSISATNNNYLKFSTNATERMRITSAGNVGIGTTTPTVPLHIKTTGGVNATLNLEASSFTPVFRMYSGGASIIPSINYGTGSGNPGLRFQQITTGAGIDGATTERMRIDSSGNLLVGTTSTTPAVSNDSDGIALQANGTVQFSANATTTAIINRKATDGNILQFRKDGTAVGNIGSYLGSGVSQFYISGADTGFKINSTVDVIAPSDASGGDRNNAISLGDSGNRWKDLYIGNDIGHLDAAGNVRLLYDKSANLLGNAGSNLQGVNVTVSGNIYLGGTTSANALDDYEEGTFTPTLNNLSGTLQTAKYRKIGDVVHIHLYYTGLGGGSASDAYVSGLPFSIPVSQYSPFIVSTQASNAGLTTHLMGRVDSGGSSIYFYNNNDNRLHGTVIDGGAFLAMQISYFTS